MSRDEMAEYMAAQNRLVRRLLECTEALLALNGPDAAQRKKMLELAKVIATVDPNDSLVERFEAAKQLAQLVLRHVETPRPLGLPRVAAPVVSVEGDKEAC